MPYPFAHRYLIALCILVIFSLQLLWHMSALRIAQYYWELTTLIWLILMTNQIWIIQYRKILLHKLSGKFSLLVAALVIHSHLLYAHQALLGLNSIEQQYGFAISLSSLVAAATFAVLYFLALFHVKNTRVHANFMLSTAFLLIGPSLSKAIGLWLPGFELVNIENYLINWIFASICVFCACILFICKNRNLLIAMQPFVIVACATLVQGLAILLIGEGSIWAYIAKYISHFERIDIAILALPLAVFPCWLAYRQIYNKV